MRKTYRTDQNDDTHIFVCANHLKLAVCIPQSPPLFWDLDSRAGRTPMKFAEVCGAAYILAFLIYAALRGHGMAMGMAKG